MSEAAASDSRRHRCCRSLLNSPRLKQSKTQGPEGARSRLPSHHRPTQPNPEHNRLSLHQSPQAPAAGSSLARSLHRAGSVREQLSFCGDTVSSTTSASAPSSTLSRLQQRASISTCDACCVACADSPISSNPPSSDPVIPFPHPYAGSVIDNSIDHQTQGKTRSAAAGLSRFDAPIEERWTGVLMSVLVIEGLLVPDLRALKSSGLANSECRPMGS